jgi:hypothetical protein
MNIRMLSGSRIDILSGSGDFVCNIGEFGGADVPEVIHRRPGHTCYGGVQNEYESDPVYGKGIRLQVWESSSREGES